MTLPRHIQILSGSIHQRRPAVNFGLISIRNYFFWKNLNKLFSHTAQPRRRAEPHALPRRQLRGQHSASQRAWRTYISACTSELCCALSHATGATITRGCSPAAAPQPHAIVQLPLAAPPTRVQPQRAAVTDAFFSCCGAGACRLTGIQTIELRMHVLIC